MFLTLIANDTLIFEVINSELSAGIKLIKSLYIKFNSSFAIHIYQEFSKTLDSIEVDTNIVSDIYKIQMYQT